MRIDERLEDIPHTLKQLGHGKLLQQPPDRTHETQGLQAAGQAGQVRGVSLPRALLQTHTPALDACGRQPNGVRERSRSLGRCLRNWRQPNLARLAIEDTGGAELRVDKITRLIREFCFSIHDISRVNVDAASPLPRFDMLFEAGVAFGACRFDRVSAERGRHFMLLNRVARTLPVC